ncbi:MAG TPA: hypothetical protein VFX05_12255 [Casimicrobiaceae bacterium]|nr:hypothetical protein [Casimicrobiaceae bacterium]
MRFSLLAVLLALAIAPGAVDAAITSTVVDIPVRNTTQRFLDVRPEAPVANIVALTGGSGRLGLRDDGTMTTRESRCGPVVRNRLDYAARGFALALVDGVSDQMGDLRAIVDYMQARAAVPTWIVGGSSSTVAAARLAADLGADTSVGVIFVSPESVDPALAGSIVRPALVLWHNGDAGQRGPELYTRLTAAPVRERLGLDGGSNANCTYHLFEGLDAAFVAATSEFMTRVGASLGSAPPAAEAVAVEYYHAGLDHYFVTHVAGEIAALDGGTLQGWTRTGQSFKVWTGPGAGTSPVCRYYIPPDKGNSHFYGRGTAECAAAGANNPTFQLEDAAFFHVRLPVQGACPAGTRNIHRVFSNRADVNHRYVTDPALRDQMVGRGWIAEGEGDDVVVMCGPP